MRLIPVQPHQKNTAMMMNNHSCIFYVILVDMLNNIKIAHVCFNIFCFLKSSTITNNTNINNNNNTFPKIHFGEDLFTD